MTGLVSSLLPYVTLKIILAQVVHAEHFISIPQSVHCLVHSITCRPPGVTLQQSELLLPWQVNEGLSDSPAGLLDFSMKQELEQVTHHGHISDAAVAALFETPVKSYTASIR